MASIRKDILIEACPEDVWAAVRDAGAVHQRLGRGFLVDARLDGDARVVTFANGAVAREALVDVNDEARRFVYSVVEGSLPITHHNASMQVFDEDPGRSRIVWIADVLPDEVAVPISALMEQAARAIKQTLEQEAARNTA